MALFDEASFECSVCMEYFVDPKQLECGHSLCASCAERLTNRNTVPRASIQCPECKTRSLIPVKGLPTNYPLQNLTYKFRIYAKTEVQCAHCNGNKINVCEACVGNSFQLLAGQTSNITGKWKYESQTNVGSFLKELGFGCFSRFIDNISSPCTLTILELAGGKNWLVFSKGWFSRQTFKLEMNETKFIRMTKDENQISSIRYNAANDCLESIVEVQNGSESRSIVYKMKKEVQEDKLVITYSTPSGVHARRVYRRLPLDLERLF